MTALLISTVLSLVVANLASGVVQHDFHKVKELHETPLSKRAGPVFASLQNEAVLYLVNVTLGHPPQFVQLLLGTATSDTWVTDSSAAYCQQQACGGLSYDPAQSTSYNALQTIFNITYADGTGSSGVYFTDTFSIGGISLTAVELGLANVTTIGRGIMGLSFPVEEAICNNPSSCSTYPTILDQMVSQGKINSHAYSLWLNDVDASTGSILFGGVDAAKYHPPLLSLPIEKDDTGSYSNLAVNLTQITVTQGNVQSVIDPKEPVTVVLDVGSTLTFVPDELFAQIQPLFNATYDSAENLYTAECSLRTNDATVDFHFGDSSGPTINAPFRELLSPLPDGNSSLCSLGIYPAGSESSYLFGDTFLRNAYVVYDLDNKLISLANTIFDSATSNIIAIPAGSAGASGVAATVTATAWSTSSLSGTTSSTSSLAVSTIVVGATTSSVTVRGSQTAVVTTSGGPVSTATSTTAATASSTSNADRTESTVDGLLLSVLSSVFVGYFSGFS